MPKPFYLRFIIFPMGITVTETLLSIIFPFLPLHRFSYSRQSNASSRRSRMTAYLSFLRTIIVIVTLATISAHATTRIISAAPKPLANNTDFVIM